MSQYGHLGGVYGQRAKKGEAKDESLDHEFQNVNDSSYKPWVQFEIRFDPIRKQTTSDFPLNKTAMYIFEAKISVFYSM